jgi:hypothetical protein
MISVLKLSEASVSEKGKKIARRVAGRAVMAA